MEIKKTMIAERVIVILEELAEWTGLEPATLGVTGRYSNQLNYHSVVFQRFVQGNLVGAKRLELLTFAL